MPIQITDKIDELNAYAYEHRNSLDAESQQMAEKAITLAEKEQYKKGISEALCTIGWRNILKFKFAEAREESERALLLAIETADPSLEARALNNIGHVYYNTSDYTKALDFSSRSLSLYEKLGDKLGIAFAFNNLGNVNFSKGEYTTALDYHYRTLSLHEELGNQKGIAYSLNNIGLVYQKVGNYSKSLDYYFRSLEIKEELGAKHGIAVSLTNIGIIFQLNKEYEKAIAYHERALILSEEMQDEHQIALSYGNLGNNFKSTGQYDKALNNISKALSIFTKNNVQENISKSLGAIGSIYHETGQYEKAVEFYNQSIEIDIKSGNKNGISTTLMHLGVLFATPEFPRHDFKKATQYLYDALDIAEQIDSKRLQFTIHLKLAELFEKIADWKNFGIHFRQYHDIEREIYNKESAAQIRNLEIQKQLSDLEKDHEFEQRKNAELAEINSDLQDACEQVRTLNEHLTAVNYELDQLNTEKNEFLGIAAQGIQTPLTGIILQTQLILNYYDRLDKAEIFEKISLIEHTATRMSNTVGSLLSINAIESGKLRIQREEISSQETFKEIISEYKNEAEQKEIELHAEIEEASIIADKIALIQVIENLLSNAVKYSPKRKKIYVRAQKAGNLYRIEIGDEGPGLTKEDKTKLFQKFSKLSAKPTGGERSTGLGLSIVNKLVEAMNGKVICESEAGYGAKFIVELPIVL
ncbi:MAG: tetratricopeptide repeat-containing sensor histidine kinase [Bacteroidota bacterium]